MTSIHLCISEREMVLVIKGHAGYRNGDDIVCAAISVLGQAAVATVLDMQKEHRVDAKATMKSGLLKLFAGYPEEMQKEMESRMLLAKNGFLMLELAYPEHVKCHFHAVQTKKLELW